MAVPEAPPYEALRDRLLTALDTRKKAVIAAERWYDGIHPAPPPRPYTLASVDAEARKAYDNMCTAGIMNWVPPVVDSPAAKCIVTGIRFGQTGMSSDPEAWEIWQRNQMDADHQLAIADALKVGSAPVIVWYDDTDKAKSSITIEDPAQVIIAYEAGSRRKRQAALKRWVDEYGYSFVTLYTPEWIYKWRSKSAASTITATTSGPGDWDERRPDNEPWPLPNPLKLVPVFELRANPTSRGSDYGGGTPEFVKMTQTQLRINRHVFYMLNTEEAQSFRQRWATDWDYPTNDDGTPDLDKMIRFAAAGMATFNSDPDSDRQVRVGEFAQADFRPLTDILNFEVKQIASTTSTPPDAFLIGDMINVAAEALAGIRGKFTAKVRRHTTFFGEDLEEILRCALLVERNPKADDYSLSVDWISPEDRTATEQGAVAQAYKAVGAPMEAVFAALPDVDRQEARRWMVDAATQALVNPPPLEPAPIP